MWYLGSTPIVERNYGLVFSAFFFTTLAVVIIGVRVYTRVVLVRNVGLDDSLIVVALAGSLSYLTASMYQIRYGLGDAVRLEELQSFLIALYVTVVSYSFTQLMVKFSILFQYKRIFQTPLAGSIFLGLMIWLTAYGSVCLGTSIFTCWPVAKYWDDTIPGGCIDRSVLHYLLAGFNILNDFALLCVPIPFLRKLNVNKRVKWVLIGVFACGSFACVAPIDEQPLFGLDIALWSCLEINIAMICASVPSIKALFVKLLPGLISSHDASKPTYGRSADGSLPLHDFGHTGRSQTGAAAAGRQGKGGKGKMEITVQQTFEMRTIETEDDGSEKDLVTRSWAADTYPGGSRGSAPQGRADGPGKRT
ncbi:hypothetical protein QBC46DRAFT_462564 [Diplogelasinospora grovesii]|uniref:Rhodopsin domain-containing protein n=1 Tax=Diplogelasinospora grovesii TaxID=303347 RepID=A0AAN6RZI5_9PEZI|nr:hypothetical protein QBC46DRAFT_462564 [Diplogelasinospora grovesii]